jgi:hypothetical protein
MTQKFFFPSDILVYHLKDWHFIRGSQTKTPRFIPSNYLG